MSSNTKDPLQKQETTSESSDSQSDNEVSKAEENLEHLKIEERLTKDDSDKSKLLDDRKDEDEGGLASECDKLHEPTAGPSGLQEPRLKCSHSSSDSKSKVASFTDPQNEKDVELDIGERMVEDSDTTCSTPPFIQSSTGATPSSQLDDYGPYSDLEIDVSKMIQKAKEAKDIERNAAERIEKGDSDTTSSTSAFIQSSTGETPSSMLDEKSPVAGPNRLEGEDKYLPRTSGSRRFDYACDSANTLSDVSEIQSEMVDTSAEASVCLDAAQKEKNLEAKDIERNVGARMGEGNFDTTSSLPPCIQSSVGATHSPMLDDCGSDSESKLDLFKYFEREKDKETKDIDRNVEEGMVEDSDTTYSTPTFLQSSTGATPSSQLDDYGSYSESEIHTSEMIRKAKEAKGVNKNIAVRMEKRDSDSTYSTPPFLQSSTGATPSSQLDDYGSYSDMKIDISEMIQKAKEAKDVDKNVAERMEKDSASTSNTSAFIQSCPGANPSGILDETSPVAEQSRLPGEADYSKLPKNIIATHLMRKSLPKSSRSRRVDYACDSANTSSDASEIWSEVVDTSAKASVFPDASQILVKEKPPCYASAVERQISESSDTNISELQDDIFPPPRTPSSTSASTSNSGEQDQQAYLSPLQIEADTSGIPVSTSSSEIGFYRHNIDNPNRDVSDHGSVPLPTIKCMEDNPILGDQQIQVFDKPNAPEDAMRGCVPRRKQVESSVEDCSTTEGSPSKRRRQSKSSSESCKEKGTTEKSRQRFKTIAGKKSIMISSKSSVLQTSSESTESKSSSDESHRKESLELENLSETKEFSKSDKGRKSWQKSGLLHGMQISAMSSKDSIIAEEEDATSLEEKDPKLMETDDPIPEKMETTPERGNVGADKNTKPSEAIPSIESRDQACGFVGEGTSKEHEQSFGVSDFERSVGKSKREPKVSNSPPSDEMPRSSPLKVVKSRPKKKARSDRIRRTRHDSADPFPENLQQSESTSTPDFSDYSGSEAETAF